MRTILVGADLEENLGLGMLAASAGTHGHAVSIEPFNSASEAQAVAARIVSLGPDVVGLSIQFQHRAPDFLGLARILRSRGYKGFIIAGGQFPTVAHRELLTCEPSINAIALYEAETTFPELLDALQSGRAPESVPGLAFRAPDGAVLCSEHRPQEENLDAMPQAHRYRPHTRHVGVPFIPMLGSRGCWGRCAFCSIAAFHRDARSHGSALLFRTRSPENIAEEMARLAEAAGGRAIFCFHDDNFTLPRPAQTLARMQALDAALKTPSRQIGRYGIVGKARPETLTPELAVSLAEMGVIRLYIGVENASGTGSVNLARGSGVEAASAALNACEKAGIFACYNLLVFEPHASLQDVADNVRFIRDHADHPVNFCRAEPYYGTPLHQELAARTGQSSGPILNYRIDDPEVELLFRICATAFRERNFEPHGVANRYMGLRYCSKLLSHFYGAQAGRVHEREAQSLTRRISLDTASFLDRAIALAKSFSAEDADALERGTVRLGLDIAAADQQWHAELDDLFISIEKRAHALALREPRAPAPQRRQPMMGGMALSAALAVVNAGCDGNVVDPAPGGAGYAGHPVDALPGGAGGTGGTGGDGGFVADPLPGGAGGMWYDPVPGGAGGTTGWGGHPVDALPGGAGGAWNDPLPGGSGGGGSPVVDPLPAPGASNDWRDDAPSAADPSNGKDGVLARATSTVSGWRDPVLDDLHRSQDLPLYVRPTIELRACRNDGAITVSLLTSAKEFTIRWEAGGVVEGDGQRVVWTPLNELDRIRVALRAHGGVAFRSLGVKDVVG